jgi:tRNA dimethylallyltransferase
MPQKHLLTVIGPTAIGKTEMAIRLAENYNTEILSCDSRQFYREMRIGTAVPSESELSRVKHHFIQNKSIHESYSVGEFEKESLQLLSNQFRSKDMFVMAGGSGLYVDAVVKGLDEFPKVDPAVREGLIEELQNKGLAPLQERLKELDPVSYARMDIQNKQRVIRALEICQGTGKAFSSYWNKSGKKRPFKTLKIGLRADRETVYERINQRVDIMMDMGLLEEARGLYDFRHLNALQTVGYKEIFQHLEGKTSLEDAISEIKKNTRRFAKRQGTWFKKDEEISWFDFDSDISVILEFIESQIKN